MIDFGQNMSALIQVTAAGKKGDVIRLDCFEVLDSKGNVYLDNLRRGKGISSVYIRGRRNHHIPSVIHIYGIPLCEDRFLSR